MALSALEEKINKIRQQNEEIRRRYEEVEEDKKNAAKSNALVQMIPSTDWPERKEPPEFSNPIRNVQRPKLSPKEYNDHPQQHHIGNAEGKKTHVFAHGDGPPPDPKYNFLADVEREEHTEGTRDAAANRGRNKPSRGNFKKRGTGREALYKDNRTHHAAQRDECPPEYDAWRAERNRIDEDRISRQKTAEGNWRREWDNDKAHAVDEAAKRETRPTLSNFIKRDHKGYEKRYYPDANEHTNHHSNSHRSHPGTKNYHGNHDYRYNNYEQHGPVSPTLSKVPLSPGAEERSITATDKSIKVTLNQGNMAKGPVTSVKVSSPSIAGTGRVGPRQRTRVTYSSHSEIETNRGSAPFTRQKSFEDKSKAVNFAGAQKPNNLRRPQPANAHPQRKKEVNAKSPYSQRKDYQKEENAHKPYYSPKSPKPIKRSARAAKHEEPAEANEDGEKLPSDDSTRVESKRKDETEAETEKKSPEDPTDAESKEDETTKVEKSDTENVEVANTESIVGNEDKDNTRDVSTDSAMEIDETALISHENVETNEKSDTEIVEVANTESIVENEDKDNNRDVSTDSAVEIDETALIFHENGETNDHACKDAEENDSLATGAGVRDTTNELEQSDLPSNDGSAASDERLLETEAEICTNDDVPMRREESPDENANDGQHVVAEGTAEPSASDACDNVEEPVAENREERAEYSAHSDGELSRSETVKVVTEDAASFTATETEAVIEADIKLERRVELSVEGKSSAQDTEEKKIVDGSASATEPSTNEKQERTRDRDEAEPRDNAETLVHNDVRSEEGETAPREEQKQSGVVDSEGKAEAKE